MIQRLIRWWRARRAYKELCEAMEYSRLRREAMERWSKR
jgi:hypothetical protein